MRERLVILTLIAGLGGVGVFAWLESWLAKHRDEWDTEHPGVELGAPEPIDPQLAEWAERGVAAAVEWKVGSVRRIAQAVQVTGEVQPIEDEAAA